MFKYVKWDTKRQGKIIERDFKDFFWETKKVIKYIPLTDFLSPKKNL